MRVEPGFLLMDEAWARRLRVTWTYGHYSELSGHFLGGSFWNCFWTLPPCLALLRVSFCSRRQWCDQIGRYDWRFDS